MFSIIMSSSYVGAKQYEISDLPPEILQRIFKYLSANERKAVKLACKSWLEYCNVLSLLDDEVLMCQQLYPLPDIYELLGNSERKFLNLKFENVTFDHGSSFWESNGPRIRSIDFQDCLFPNGILEEIITFCENLVHLSFTYTIGFHYIVEDEDSLPPIKDLEKVSAKRIVRETLDSLEIYIMNSEWICLSDYILHQLLLIFPKVKVLKITSDLNCTRVIDLDDMSELANKSRVTMSPVLNYLIVSADQIEKLKLFTSARFSQNSLRYILKTLSSLKRLTELSFIGVENEAKLEDIGTTFCSTQLKSLEFGLDLHYTDDLTLFLSRLLLSNSSLQYLKINHFNGYFAVTKPFYEKLMSSGLKSFYIITNMIGVEDLDSFSSYSSAQNRATVLPSLSASIFSSYNQDELRKFLKYYQNLHHLELKCIAGEDLQFLLQYQKKLRSLRILHSYWSEKFDVRSDDLSFNELTDIECLDLEFGPAARFFLETLSPKPILSKLKYLRISTVSVDETLWPTFLLRLADAAPFLEGFHISSGYKVSFDVVLELCTKLSRLRYWYSMDDWSAYPGNAVLTLEHYGKVFSLCSSLRVLVHGFKTYFLDTFHKKVTLKLGGHRYNFSRPKIGEFTVSWLEF